MIRSWLRQLLAGRQPIQTLLKLARAKPEGASWLAAEFVEPRSRGFLGRSRHRELSYRLFLPPRHHAGERVPLLLMLHGCTQNALEFAEGSRMNALAAEAGVAVLYPEQRTRANSLRCWNWFDREALAGEGEAALLMRVLDAVLARYPLDERQVYVCGFSAGAAMAAVLAARFGGRFSACAIFSGLMYAAADNAIDALKVMRNGSDADPAQLARALAQQLGAACTALPTLVIHGAADEVVNPINAAQAVAQLRALHEQLGAPLWAGVESEVHLGERRCLQRDYHSGERLWVRSLAIDSLGHAWCGGDARHAYFESAGPDASRLILDFMLAASRAAATLAEPQPISA